MSSDKRDKVRWNDSPETDPRIFYPIWTPKDGKDVNVVIVSDTLKGVYLHYYDRRDRPCLFEKELCEGCQRGTDRRWTGFLAAWHPNTGRLGLVKLTREAFLRCPQFEVYRGELRGKTLRLTRNGEARNSRVTASIGLYAGAPGRLPPAFNIQSALERIWFVGGDRDQADGSSGTDATAGEEPKATQAELPL